MLEQLVVSGLGQGAIYALVALSMTVVYRATTIVNFGHGDFVMAGAFTVYVFVVYVGLPYAAAAVLAVPILFAFGAGAERGLIRPMLGGPHLAMAMMAIAIGYGLRGAARVLWGREIFPFPRVFPSTPLLLGDLVVTGDALVTGGVVLALLAVFFAVFHLTALGKRLQAVYQSPRGASLIGLNVGAFHQGMWGVGAALGAVAGMLVAPVTLLYPDMAVGALIRGFAAMTLGGFGSLHGAVVGGLALGVMELVIGGFLSTALIDITPYLVIIVVLLVRPAGLFGRPAQVRV